MENYTLDGAVSIAMNFTILTKQVAAMMESKLLMVKHISLMMHASAFKK